jgi:hypothetical protein
MRASFCRLCGLATPCRWRCFAGRRLNDFRCSRDCDFGHGFRRWRLGCRRHRSSLWKSSIAPACFAAESSSCERPAIPLGDRYRMTRIRARHSVGARHAA